MTLRTLGRGFWIGIAASLLLHALLFSTGRFQLPHWSDETVLETRLEPVEFKAVTLPEPKIISEARPSPPRHNPDPTPSQAAAPIVDPAPATVQPPVAHVEPATAPQAALPLPEDAAPPASARPHGALTQSARNLKTLPSRIEIVFELNGMLSGRQTHQWRRDGQRYSLETEGEVTGLASLFVRGKLTQISQGQIGNIGLMPEYYEMQRLSGKKESLRFDYDSNLIEASRLDAKGKRALELPLLSGAQDPLSSIYQLAMAAQGDGDGLIVAAGAKRIKGYAYHVRGTEKLETALGTLNALHVTRAGDSGHSSMHLWLSPEHHYLPVKVTYIDEDGTEWILEAIRIKAE